MRKGTAVIITFNPHDASSQDILGTVEHTRIGDGFGGTDMHDVSYERAADGKRVTMPFSPSNLEPVTVKILIDGARKAEARAKNLRKLALDITMREEVRT